jgi:hypothetical protein
MGDAKSGPVRLSFNPQLRVEFRGATVTSDAGLLLPLTSVVAFIPSMSVVSTFGTP